MIASKKWHITVCPLGSRWIRVCVLLCVCVLSAVSAPAQNTRPGPLRAVDIEQRLGEQVPLELLFRDETGKSVPLRAYFGDKPVILALVYYECPMLCTLVLNGLLRSLRALSFNVGDEFTVVTVSFNPRDTPAIALAKKQAYLHAYARPGAASGWHFLTGEEASIQKLTHAVGFRYVYDAATEQYAHASGIMVLTPQGKLARYFYGIEYAPRDLRFGLIEASANTIGSPVDRVLLFCYHYDPVTGKYGVLIWNVLRVAGLVTVLSLGTFMVMMFRRDRRKEKTADTGDGQLHQTAKGWLTEHDAKR